MTTRNEPSLGNLFNIFATKTEEKVVVDHEQLVNNALDAFTRAEQKMSAAIDTINVHIDADNNEISEIQNRIKSSNASKDKLTRVLDRVRAFTA
ncbi:hypothetical protein D3C75_756880 [compost metagenome]